MAVYVDDMAAPYRGMKMCHVIADSSSELMAMMRTIGVATRHVQFPGTFKEHFDICITKRRKALSSGAVQITMRQLACMVTLRQRGEPMTPVETAVERRLAKTISAQLNLMERKVLAGY